MDLHNNLHTKTLFPPLAAQTNADTARTSNIIDTAGFDSLELVLINGTNTDANATFAVTLAESDDSGMSGSNSVAAADLIGALADMAFTAASDDGETRKIGYKGIKRYVQMTVTPTGNNSGDWFMAGLAIQGTPRKAPTANPPQ